jgi:hypothetical protein
MCKCGVVCCVVLRVVLRVCGGVRIYGVFGMGINERVGIGGEMRRERTKHTFSLAPFLRLFALLLRNAINNVKN